MKFIFLPLLLFLLLSFSSFSQGIIRGKATDENGEAAIGATVVLKSNPSIGTATDLDGNYTLKLADTVAQTLVVSLIGYKKIEVLVQPLKGKVVIKNFDLRPDVSEMKEVEIVGKVVKSQDTYMEKFKTNSATTLDYISSQTMKKTGDANVVAAVARVSGVSTNGGFITVRGIGDRYVKTTINGSRIPTLDPFTNNIKLDLFPASLIDNVIITKTASPDLPADWAGAYISVETKDYPDKLSVNVESSVGYNAQSSFKEILTSQKSSTDWLGYDSNRDFDHSKFNSYIPNPTTYQEFVGLGLGDYFKSIGVTSSTPWNETYYKLGLVQLGILPKAQFNDPEASFNAQIKYQNGLYKSQALGNLNSQAVKSAQSFSNNWNTFYKKGPLNYTQSFSIGNQVTLFGRPLGFFAGFRYGNSVRFDGNSIINRADAGGGSGASLSLSQQITTATNGWSSLFNLAYKLNSNNSISFLFMPNLIGVDRVRDAQNYEPDANYKSAIIKSIFYEERKQLVYQLKSEHYLPSQKLKIEVNASYTNGRSNIPDFKDYIIYFDTANFISTYFDQPIRAFRYLKENIFDSRLSGELPFGGSSDKKGKLKFGGAYQHNTRDLDQYNYALNINNDTKTAVVSSNDLEQFFSSDKFGISNTGNTVGSFLYYTNPFDAADHTIGFSSIKSVFVLADYIVLSPLRVSGGVRLEQADIFTDVFKYDSLGLERGDPRRKGLAYTSNPGLLNTIDLLPSVNVIYKLRNSEVNPINLRLNYSNTLARPSIREISETFVFDYELRDFVYGNSDLKPVKINNYDLRLESYFKSGDNVSLSFFYKKFRNHIEVVQSGIGYSWQNAEKSNVTGIELEGKKRIMKGLEFRSNITFVKSVSELTQNLLQVDGGGITYIPIKKIKRNMFGQAPYIINAVLSYSFDSIGLSTTLSYNIQGPRLVIASVNLAPDVYELARHLLNLKISKTLGKYFSASLTVRDIFNAPIRRSYKYDSGGNIDFNRLDFDRYTYGTDYVFGISYKL